MPFDDRMNVLQEAFEAIAAHIFVGSTEQIAGQAVRHLLAQAHCRRGLEQRQFVELVVLVVEHGEAIDLTMRLQPSHDFIAPRLLRHIGNDVDKGDAPVFGAK